MGEWRKGQLPVREWCLAGAWLARAHCVAAAGELALLGGLCPPAAGRRLETWELGC